MNSSPPQATKRPRAGTQLATVLELLEESAGQWVGVGVLIREARCAATHSAIATLRTKYGFQIDNRQERVEGGIVHSFYRLTIEEGGSHE